MVHSPVTSFRSRQWWVSRKRIAVVAATAATVFISISFGALPTAQASVALTSPVGQASMPEASASCPDVIFIGARGSGESDVQFEGEGPNVYAISQAMKTALATHGVTFSSVGVTRSDGYLADPVGDFVPTAAQLKALLTVPLNKLVSYYYDHNVKPFLNSIAGGVTATEKVTKYWAGACPDSQLVLSGYSQGAMAVHQAEDVLYSSDQSTMRHVAATVLLADGDLTPTTDAKTFGSAPAQGREGVQDFGQRYFGASGIPREVPVPKLTAEICNSDDIVCDFPSSLVKFVKDAVEETHPVIKAATLAHDLYLWYHVHTSYVSDTGGIVTSKDPALTSAAKWAATLILRITTTHLPSSIEGTAVSDQLAAVGGVKPYTWSGSADGLAVNPNGTITGTPSASGSFLLDAKVTSSSGTNATAKLNLVVSDGCGGAGTVTEGGTFTGSYSGTWSANWTQDSTGAILSGTMTVVADGVGVIENAYPFDINDDPAPTCLNLDNPGGAFLGAIESLTPTSGNVWAISTSGTWTLAQFNLGSGTYSGTGTLTGST